MIILGLGSNIGDRLSHLRKALNAIKNLPGLVVQQVSPVYISDALLPDGSPPEWDQPYLNLALRCSTELEPEDLLAGLKNIEYTLGRKPEIRHWGPRIIDIDILAWKDRILATPSLTVPHANLTSRPFALWPLADVAPFWRFPLAGSYQGKLACEMAESFGSRFSGEAPFHTRQIPQRVDGPQLVGILNVTPDSFSDGGKFLSPEIALQQIHSLLKSGAEIIDIGAESTAPHSVPCDVATEWSRLQPILSAVNDMEKPAFLSPKISLDTRRVEIVEKALACCEINWINDVSGLQDTRMQALLASTQLTGVIMHHVSLPASRFQTLSPYEDNVKLIYDWGATQIKKLEKAGIPSKRLIFDPGIGFGKTAEHSLAIIKNIACFAQLGISVLAGHSRKSFLSLLTAHVAAERDLETAVLSHYLFKQPVDYLRVHNVDMTARCLKVAGALY